jgi:hypothetical protein
MRHFVLLFLSAPYSQDLRSASIAHINSYLLFRPSLGLDLSMSTRWAHSMASRHGQLLGSRNKGPPQTCCTSEFPAIMGASGCFIRDQAPFVLRLAVTQHFTEHKTVHDRQISRPMVERALAWGTRRVFDV